MSEENKQEFDTEQEVTESENTVKKEEPKINVEDVKEKVAEVKEKMGEVKDKIKEKLEEKTVSKEKIKPLVTSRILFISALDKILLIWLIIVFLSGTIFNLRNSYSTFMNQVFTEIGIVIFTAILYLFLNWLYKCAAKTMLCLTNNEVYLEMHAPFVRNETSIPLHKITGVTTVNVLWIFRTIIIHQYGKLPVVFGTWNNQEFKNKLNELITTDKGQVENEYQNRNILSKNSIKFIKYLGLGLAAVMILVGIGRAISFMTSPARNIPGTYTYNNNDIIFKSNGTCNIDSLEDDVTECTWEYFDETSKIQIDYKYKSYSYYFGTTTKSDYFYLTYNKDEKTITYSGDTYTKQKGSLSNSGCNPK